MVRALCCISRGGSSAPGGPRRDIAKPESKVERAFKEEEKAVGLLRLQVWPDWGTRCCMLHLFGGVHVAVSFDGAPLHSPLVSY